MDCRSGVDAVNLFDEEPPFVNIAQSPNGGGGFDPTLNNPVGRIVGLTLRKEVVSARRGQLLPPQERAALAGHALFRRARHSVRRVEPLRALARPDRRGG